MISSARQGCVRSVSYALGRPSWSLALHAESSAQALRRANFPPPPLPLTRPIHREAHSRARFSAAAAAVLSHDQVDQSDRYDDTSWDHRPSTLSPEYDELDPPPNPTLPLPRLREIRDRLVAAEPPEPPLVRFRRCTTQHPLLSLLSLKHLPPDELASITLHELDTLVSSLNIHLRQVPIPSSVEFDDIHSSLVQLRGAISDHIRKAGRLFSGRRFHRFLRVCLLLDDRDLVRSLWRERVEVGQWPVGIARDAERTRLIQILAVDLRDWRMLLWMFSPAIFPERLYTANVLERYMQAHLATRQPEAVPKLFEKHSKLKLKVNSESYNHLLQAYLQLGDMEGARLAGKQGRVQGGLTRAMQQLSILRGHRTLGAGLDLEEKVFRDLEKLGQKPEADIVNALIKLRMDDDDMKGAEILLGRLGLARDQGTSLSGENITQPSSDSLHLAMRVASRTRDLPRVRSLWSKLCQNPVDVTDAAVSQLVSILGQEEGYHYVMSVIDPDYFYRPPIPFPPSLVPGVLTLNALLRSSLKRDDNLDLIHRTLRLFPQLNVEPNSHTVKLILEHLDMAHTPPASMAVTLRDLHTRYPALKPTIDQLNVILSSSLKSPFTKTLLPSSNSTTSPSAGLTAINSLRRVIEPILSDLNDRQAVSDSTSLAIRLKYDTLAHAAAGGIPAANAVWESLIARGFRPDKRHVLAMMSGYAESGAMTEAQSLLQLAREMEIEPTQGMYMALLVGWGEKGDLDKARAAYDQISASPEGADMICVTAMIKAYYDNVSFDKAAKMTKEVLLPQYGENLDKKALLVAAYSLRSNNEEMTALELLGRYRDSGVMGKAHRNIVKQLKNWLRKVESKGVRGDIGRARELERGLSLCEWILQGERVAPSPGHKNIRERLLRSLVGKKAKKLGKKVNDL